MSSFRVITVVLFVALTSFCALAQTQTAAKRAPDDGPASGTITGKVIDERGQPLTNAVVYARVQGAVGPQRSLSVITDREGSFKFTGIDRASYILSATLAAYTNPPFDPTVQQTPTYHLGDSATLTLIKGGVITGTVTNLAGEPLVGIGVRVQMLRDANGRRFMNNAGYPKLTDDRGVYRIYGLPAGTYVVLAGGSGPYSSNVSAFDGDAPTYSPSSTRDTAAEVTVRSGEEAAGVDIRYRAEQGRIVSGQVTVASEAGGFNVTLMSAGDSVAPWSSSQYQQAGTRAFSFNGVADGDYALVAVSFSSNGERALSTKRITLRGADLTGIELVTKPLSSIAGRVLLADSKAPECAGKPRPALNEMAIFAWHNDNEAAKQIPQPVWSLGAPVTPDAEGNFTLKNLLPAEYYFAVRQPVKYWYLQSIQLLPPPVTGSKVASKPIDATRTWTNIKSGDKLSGLAVTIAQGAASLRGQIALSEGEQVPPKLFAYFVPAEPEKAEEVLRYFAVPVSPDGKIAVLNIAPGHYWVMTQTVADDTPAPITKLRLPQATETRARFRREAQAAKNEIEFKPCQNVTDFQLSLKPPQQ